jgi:hypothetical protein
MPEASMLRYCAWESPLLTSDEPSLPLFTDPNNYGWIYSYWAVVPHTATGPRRSKGSTFLALNAQLTPSGLGAEGGNVCSLDGPVLWRPIGQMKSDYWIYESDFGNRGMW